MCVSVIKYGVLFHCKEEWGMSYAGKYMKLGIIISCNAIFTKTNTFFLHLSNLNFYRYITLLTYITYIHIFITYLHGGRRQTVVKWRQLKDEGKGWRKGNNVDEGGLRPRCLKCSTMHNKYVPIKERKARKRKENSQWYHQSHLYLLFLLPYFKSCLSFPASLLHLASDLCVFAPSYTKELLDPISLDALNYSLCLVV